ncbi:MAG: acyltransferase family protein [Bacteroidota bacterium]
MSASRSQGLDFLRGIAIILVMLRHQSINDFSYHIGWIGVDLFFVLSGFLVAGILFKEQHETGKTNVGRFLIRRGLKIYPVYYIFYLPYLWIATHPLDLNLVLADLFFIQNYINGWGYAYPASWSLAVEEHFYMALALSFMFYCTLSFQIKKLLSSTRNFIAFCTFIFVACLLMRISSNTINPDDFARNQTLTHLRIDSLMAGVLLAYLHLFHFESLMGFVRKYKLLLGIISILLLSWTPYLDAQTSVFVRTWGFTMLYIAFSFVLLLVLSVESNHKPEVTGWWKIFKKQIAKIGIASYSIYVIHTLVNKVFNSSIKQFDMDLPSWLDFTITTSASVLLGLLIKKYVEDFFLRFRDKQFPSRV